MLSPSPISRQIDLFEKQDAFSQMELRIDNIKETLGNVQRGLFARHHKLAVSQAELFSMILELKEEMAKIRELMVKRIK